MVKLETKLKKIVEKTIENYNAFEKNERILVAISGGKDSAVTAHILKELGYDFECLHINVGINSFSSFSEKYAKIQSEKIGCKLNIIKVKKLLGRSIEEVKTNRPICSVCGITRRYLLNYFAFKKGFDSLVTGHNLDDMAVFYFHNLLNNQRKYISSLRPVLPKDEKLVKRVKPMFFVRESEILKYASIKGIEFNPLKCPYERSAKTKKYSLLLKSIDSINKNGLLLFIRNMLNFSRYEKPKRKYCKICGMPSSGEICAFCKVWNRKEPLNIENES